MKDEAKVPNDGIWAAKNVRSTEVLHPMTSARNFILTSKTHLTANRTEQ